ncbi:(Fe-S)-binding protein [Maribellus sp. CM-23]|uniref:(Fe-S)-binding protein n=1 Tax=Maribellus sp. CM-23 TaxID=2781026 RepID=UPI001F22CE1D|nr:(Fe-S)-binding protein [Maribellus sp. CM-23]MCE4564845.1 (Fe-S)-binding protein [Maribellus sp. CM-23]
MRVDVFIPCFIDQFYPDTAWSFVKVLEKAGCEVKYNPEQTCCGQPAFNSGYWNEARTVARKFIQDFDEAEIVVAPSASCTGFVRNYYHKLFTEDKVNLEKSKSIKKRLFEFSDFMINHLQVSEVGAVFNHKVTFHDSCAGLRECGIKSEPRQLLEKVKGLELVEMENLETCCGFGGTFAAKFHHISSAMTEQKVENALKTGAEYIVSTEASCLMNMDAYIRKQNLPIKTIHLVDVLATGW